MFAMLVASVDHGLERLAARLIRRLPSHYVNEEKCVELLSKQGLYTNSNIDMLGLLLELLVAFDDSEVRSRIIMQAFFSSLDFAQSNFRVARTPMGSWIWKLLPTALRQSFFLAEIPPWFDLIKEDVKEITDPNKHQLMNALFLIHASCKFADIQFILDDMPSKDVASTVKLALTLLYFYSPSQKENLDSELANGISVLLKALPRSTRDDLTGSTEQRGLALYFDGAQGLPNLHLPTMVTAYLQQKSFAEKENVKKVLAKILYSKALLCATPEELEASILPIVSRFLGREREITLSYILLDAIKFAVAANAKKEMIVHLINAIPVVDRTDIVALGLYKMLETNFDAGAVILYLDAIFACELELAVCRCFISQTSSRSIYTPFIPSGFQFPIFEKAFAHSPGYPWHHAMADCLRSSHARAKTDQLRRYQEKFSSFGFFMGAVADIARPKPKDRQIAFFKFLFFSLRQEDRQLALRYFDLCIQLQIRTDIVNALQVIFPNNAATIRDVALYDVANNTFILREFLRLSAGVPVKELVSALQMASDKPKELGVIVMAVVSQDNGQLVESLSYMLNKLIAENEKKYLITLRNSYDQLPGQYQELFVVLLVVEHFLPGKKPGGLKELKEYLFTIASITDNADQLMCIAAWVYELLSESSSKRKASRILDFLPYSDDLCVIVASLLRLAEENDNSKLVQDIFRSTSIALFFDEEKINSLDDSIRQFVHQARRPSSESKQVTLSLWHAKKSEVDVEKSVMKSVNAAFIAACDAYQAPQQTQHRSINSAVTLVKAFLQQHEVFKRSVQFCREGVDEFDRFSYKLLYLALHQFAEKNNSRRFLLVLSQRLDIFPFLRENLEEESALHETAISDMQIILTKSKDETTDDVRVKSLQKEVYTAFKNKSAKRVVSLAS